MQLILNKEQLHLQIIPKNIKLYVFLGISLLIFYKPLAFAKSINKQDIYQIEQLLDNRRWQESEKLILDLKVNYPNNTYLDNLLAISYFNQKKVKPAQDLLVKVIKSQQDTRTAYENLQKLFSYSAAKTYSEGLNLLTPVKMPELNIPQFNGPNIQIEQKIAIKKTLPRVEEKTIKPVQQIVKPLIKEPKTSPLIKETKISPLIKEKREVREEVSEALNQWVKYWESGNSDAYINAYIPNYSPKSFNRRQWINNRKLRINPSRNIKVKISNISFDKKSATIVETTFIQEYQSNQYRDKVEKKLQWVKPNDKWLINKEIQLKVL